MADAAAGAFGIFFTQSPSFLAYQRDMERNKGKNNAASLFGVTQIPSDQQIRNLLDDVEPSHLYEPFWTLQKQMEEAVISMIIVDTKRATWLPWTAPTTSHPRAFTVIIAPCISMENDSTTTIQP